MVIEIQNRICDGYALKTLFHAGMDWLMHNQERVNRLNVFPVPDGDTGKNMCLTMKQGFEAIRDMADEHVGTVANAMADGALRGARGNSGVILSQLIRGFADVLQGHAAFDADLLAQACSGAVDAAYGAVIEPTEGTILTVARETNEALHEHIQTDKDLVSALEVMLAAAQASLQRTPELLAVLKEAGVVDSGAQGLVYILEGMQRCMQGERVNFGEYIVPVEEDDDAHDWEADAPPPDDEQGYGYDVQFLMHGADMDVAQVRADIDAMGWSTLVVGSPHLVKVHVHVHDPSVPIAYAIQHSDAIDDVVVENMQLQYEAFARRKPKAEATPPRLQSVDGVAVITVAGGDGLRDLFYQMNAAYVILGGQTMNPSADDFIKAMDLLENTEFVLLPNNKNISMAAKQAASLVEGRTVHVVETVSIPQGINAMLGYLDLMDDGGLDDIVAAMTDYADSINTAEITIANRNTTTNGVQIREGQYIGLLDGDLVVSADDLDAALTDLLAKAGADEHELITLYYGSGLTENQATTLVDHVKATYAKQRVELVKGGQALYPLLIGLE